MWLGLGNAIFVPQSILWRMAYNAGLGVLLHFQSRSEVLTKWTTKMSTPSWQGKVLDLLSPRKYSHLPIPFRAWLVYRSVVDIVLTMDVVSFLALCIINFEPVGGLLDGLSIAFGFITIIGALWVKIDAHKVIQSIERLICV